MTKNKTEKRKSTKLIQLKRIGIIAALAGVALLVLMSVSLASYAFQYKGEIYPNTYISSINFGAKSISEAEQILKQKLSDMPQEIAISVNSEKAGTVPVAELHPQYDVPQTAQNLYRLGRESSPWLRLRGLFRSLMSRNEGSLVLTIDEERALKRLTSIAEKYGTQAQDAEIILENDDTVSVKPAHEGLGVTKEQLVERITAGLKTFQADIRLTASVIKPKVTEDQTSLAVEQVKGFLNKAPLTFSADEVQVKADTKKVFSWITYTLVPESKVSSPVPSLAPSPLSLASKVRASEREILVATFDQDRIKNFISDIAITIDRDPVNAELRAVDGQIRVAKEHTDGKEIKINEAVALTITTLTSLEPSQSTITLPVETIAAQVRSNNIETLGIKELLGRAETNFRGSPANRVHNITTGASFLNGELIPPGQEFSTVKTLGHVDGSTGYLPELVIKENRTIPEYGGGLCQVSTTLFRAVLNAGLKVTERQNHSYRVSYYEPPVGLDATIYLPRPDFRFLNDTPGYILVQNKVEGTKIVFELYGAKDGRVVTISDPIVTDVTEPPPASYTETDTLPKGEEKQIEKAHPGATAVATYTVTRDGKEINKQVFRSKYKPWQARYLVGTKE